MKKLTAVILTLLLVSTSVGALTDVSSMSNEELRAMIDSARNELVKRELTVTENAVLFDRDGVSFYLTGNTKIEYGELQVEGVLINGTDKTIALVADLASVNGWTVVCGGITSTAAGKRNKEYFGFYLSNSDVTTIDDVEDVELVIIAFNTETYENVFRTEPITIYF